MAEPNLIRVCRNCDKPLTNRAVRKYCSFSCWKSHCATSYHDRFWAKVQKTSVDGCWLWMARRDKYGYGVFGISNKTHLAHRVSWMIENGKLPHGKQVLHRCDNPPCVNPLHLFDGDPAVNFADCKAKGRVSFRMGEYGPMAKLTVAKVLDIRSSTLSLKAIASKHRISPNYVCSIRNGRAWKVLAARPVKIEVTR